MTLLAAACADDYDDSALWDKVNDHEERIAALEKWQEQTNQSIAAMQELVVPRSIPITLDITNSS